MSHIRGNWSELHEDLLIIIAKKLITIEDFIRFGAVCRAWRSATLDKHQFPLFSKALFPWLMLAENVDEDYRAVFSPLENNICTIKLPEARGCQCWGSPFGWLVTHSLHQGLELHLLNPFSRSRIRLPSKVDFNVWNHKNPLQSMHKAMIISITEYDNAKKVMYLVFAIIGDTNNLVMARDGLDTWITIQNTKSIAIPNIQDVIQFNGVFYTVDRYAWVDEFGKLDLVPVAKRRACPPNTNQGHSNLQKYLVEFDHELHMTVRKWSRDTYKTISIQVYKFDRRGWKKLETLGDNVVFVGRNTSFALKASEHPGCKPDCIYFTTDKEMGIFYMETGNSDYLFQGLSSPSVWIMPRIK
ncbi:hypothetical protein ACHQM5_009627 [Ranunculus cassubicifolius]